MSEISFENTTPDAQRKRRRHLPHGAKVAIVIVSIILVIAMLSLACYLAGITFFGVVIALIIVSSMPENDGTFEYRIYDDTVEIVGLVDENYPGPIYIPEYIEGLAVTSIGSSAFEETNIMEVYIPDTVTYISSYAFYECKNLTKVDMGDGVYDIGAYAFDDCTSLTEVQMSSNLCNISYGAFSECTSLEFIVIPESVEFISAGAFEDTQLKAVVFNDIYGWQLSNGDIEIPSTELEDPYKAAELLTMLYVSEAWTNYE
jgi:hypothetical protein